MATFNKINDFVDYLVEGINLASDQLMVALSNTAPANEANNPTLDGNGVLANVTQISYTNCSSRVITTSSSSQTGGTYRLIVQDLVLTASGGTVGPFRYIYVFDNTPANKPLICYYDYGSSVTLNPGETFTIDFSQISGLFQLS